jgi:Putative Ig domain
MVIYIAACFVAMLSAAEAQTQVQDIFGRSVNQRGITLVDWDGYVANPLIKFYVLPPTNAALPGTATLTANGIRLYFDTPSTVSTNGPSKTLSFSTTNAVAARLSIFPDRDSSNELYTTTFVFSDANGLRQTNTVPIQVIDLDLQRTNEFKVTVNFDRDITGFFTNADRRAIVQRVVDDWSYFFSGMNLDAVPIGAEKTYIWSNNFDGGYYFVNTNAYTGYLLYAYGTSNSVHRSGGEGSYAGGAQTSGGKTLTMQRSGGFEAEIYGNYNTLSWLFSTNDNDWLLTGNLGDETNDFFSIAHHETGHALIFNEAHSGFAAAKANGAFTSPDVTNYYGAIVPIDDSDHLNGAIDPESGQGAFGYEYYGDIPRKRWIFTKLDLLCAQEVGYVLRTNTLFNPLTFPSNALPAAVAGIYFSNTFAASGGLMSYCWDITSGALPPGLTLDSFSGNLSGTPSTNGTFNFTVRVRDYHEGSAGISHSFGLNVSTGRPQLAVSVVGAGADQQILLQLTGVAGQQQVLQASTNLTAWLPVTTNLTGTNLFQYVDANSAQFPWRFYRAQVLP